MSRLKSYTTRLVVFFGILATLFVFQLPGIVSSAVDAYSSKVSVAGAGKTSASSATSRAHPGAPAVTLQNADADPNAPLANFICFGNQSLTQAGSATYNRPSATMTDSTGCGIASSGCAGFGTGDRYNAYAFNLSGCSGTITVTASTCSGNGCGSNTSSTDTTVFVYQKASGAPGVVGNPVFDPLNPCDNTKLRSADGTLCSPQGSVIVNLCAGVFVVVVTDNLASSTGGTYNLNVSATGTGTCTVASLPTLVQLDGATANGYIDGTSINWKTGREVDNLGFNIYKEQGGKRTRVNEQLLAGSALLAGAGTDIKAGNSYSWTDSSPATNKTRYWLEDLGLDGQSTWHGPISVDRSSSGDRLPRSKGRAQVLSKLGSNASPASATVPVPRETKPPEMTMTQFTGQSDLARRPAMKLAIKNEGWYRVSVAELAAAGFDTRTDPRMFQMFVDGQEQAISVVGEGDNRLDAIEFYGVGVDSPFTDLRTYWLVSGSQPGLRITKVKGNGSRATSPSFPYTVERRDGSLYFSSLRNGEKENFFGAVIARDAVDQAISIQHLDLNGSGAEIDLGLQGVTLLSHRVRVEVNGVQVGALDFDGQTEGTTRIPLGRGGLREGQNIVRLTALGGESDVSLVRYIRITYPHTFTADGDALRFNLSGKQQVSIDGFTSSAIRVVDVTDPGAVREVTSRVEARKGSYSVTVTAPKGGGERLLLAFADNKVSGPSDMSLNRPSNLRGGRGADLVIITHRDFLDSVAPLKAARESQGFSVAVVDVEDTYDEFNFGQKSPQAVKDFLLYGRSNWQTPPRYALLVGDASLDPKGYLGFGDSDLVPTKLIDTRLMETASDDWFADFNGAGSTEMAIGRLPVRTPEEAVAMIAKIVGYDQSEPVDRVMLVADSNEDYNFEALNAGLRSTMPRNVTVRELNRGRLDPVTAESEFIAGLDDGQKIVNYVGHGSVDQWKGRLLASASASGLTNSKHLPLFVMMTCLNGYFQDAGLESLAESLMKAGGGGAAAVWASSGMTAPTEQSVMNREMFRLVLDSAGARSLTLGDAMLKAKSAVSDIDIRRTWILFGDPTMKLR